MAAALLDTLIAKNQNIDRLQAIIHSDLEFDKLSENEKKFLFTIALATGFDSNIALFLELKNHPEEIGLPPLPTDEFTKTTVVNSVIAANLAKYLEDKEALDGQIKKTFQARTEKDRALIEHLVRLAALKRQTEVLLANANAQTRQTISNINLGVKQKYLFGEIPPLDEINETSRLFVQTATQQKNLTLTRSEELAALTLITTSILAGLTDPSDINSVNEVVQAAVPKLNTPISQVFQEVQANLTYTEIPRYDVPSQTQLFPNVAVDLANLTLPENLEVPTILTLLPIQQDVAEKTKKTAENYSSTVLLNPETDSVMATLVGKISTEEEKLLVNALISDNLVERAHPTQEGAAAATVVEQLGSARIDPVAIRIFSMGLSQTAIERKIAADPNSKIAHFVSSHPNVLVRLNSTLTQLENKQNLLGPEISPRHRAELARDGTLPPQIPPPTRPGPLAGISRQFQTITNISGFLPGRASQVFNVIVHPIQSIQSYLGNFIGNHIVGQFKNWLAEKVVSRIANETLKKGAELILKQGLKQGVKLLAEQGVKRGLQSIAVALGAPTGGASLLVAAAIEAAFYVGGKVFGAIGNAVNGLFRSFTGGDFDPKAAVAAPLLFVGGIIGYLGSATAVAASSAAIIIMGSTFLGFILYISVIGMAPIIAGIAHLESGQGIPYSVVSGGVVPEGCPSGWPVASGYVTQGPRTTSTHRSTEAIDIGIPNGTPVIATHNGLARYNSTQKGYGNYVDVNGTCNGIAFTTRYAHFMIGAFSGEKLITKGQVIGYSDNTGNSTGPHLHYEIRGGNLGDINQFLPKRVTPGCIDYGNCQVNLP